MSSSALIEQVAQRTRLLLERYEALRAEQTQLRQRLQQAEAERDALRGRMEKARARVDALLQRLPGAAAEDASAPPKEAET